MYAHLGTFVCQKLIIVGCTAFLFLLPYRTAQDSNVQKWLPLTKTINLISSEMISKSYCILVETWLSEYTVSTFRMTTFKPDYCQGAFACSVNSFVFRPNCLWWDCSSRSCGVASSYALAFSCSVNITHRTSLQQINRSATVLASQTNVVWSHPRS